jgi:hypothetical protein
MRNTNGGVLAEQVTNEVYESQRNTGNGVIMFDPYAIHVEAERRANLVKEANADLDAELSALSKEYHNQRHALYNAENKASAHKRRIQKALDAVRRETIRKAADMGLELGVNLNILPKSLKKLTLTQKIEVQQKYNTAIVGDHNQRSKAAHSANATPTAEEAEAIKAYNAQVAVTNAASNKLAECQARYNAAARNLK